MLIWALFLFCISGGRGGLDYWGEEEYIQEKNCLNKDVFKNNGSICTAVEIRSMDKLEESQKALSKCKDLLSLKLYETCLYTRLNQGGNLTYCNNGDYSFHCCATNYQCEDDWKGQTVRNAAKSVQFLRDKEKFLQEKVETQGFKTCHPIVGNNASVCHEDCKLFENSTFNRQCKSRGGLLKCCIRREKVFCHECQYCCTVPFCSWNSRNVLQLAGENDFVEEDIYAPIAETKPAPLKAGLQADHMLSALNLFYKDGSDTRCLKPDQTKNSSEWDHYLPEDFVKALDEKDLRKARVIKYDNRYLNFEDPEVFTGLTGLNYSTSLKETYGFDFVSKSPPGSFSKLLRCSENCILEETGKFAKRCAKQKGFFKCCVTVWNITDFANIRNTLVQQKLVSDLNNFVCGVENGMEKCILCTSTYICMKRDLMGQLYPEYKSGDINPIGGKIIPDIGDHKVFNTIYNYQRVGFRSSFCAKQDYCQTTPTQDYYDLGGFFKSMTRDELCEVSSRNLEGKTQNSSLDPVLQKKVCQKSPSANVRICDKEALEKIPDENVKALNQHLYKLVKAAKKLAKKKKKRKRKLKPKKRKSRKKKSHVNKKRKIKKKTKTT